MIRLRVVGASDDFSHLILSNKPRGRKGSHAVEIDNRLLGVLQEAVYAQREAERPPLSSPAIPTAVQPPRVPPRELQRMLRAGMTVAQVARATDLDEQYVGQFFTPVQYERDGVTREAQTLYTEKARLGESGLPLGEAVAKNLASRRVRLSDDELADSWSATRQEGRPWIVTLTFPFRGRAKKATWTFDPRARTISASNKLAADIGWVPNGGRRPATRTTARKTTARKRPTARKTVRKPATRKKPSARKKPVARRKAASRSRTAARKKPSARKAAPRKRSVARKTATRRKPVARKSATRKPARKTTTRRKPAARRATRKPARRRSR